jgi:hypothetical protein
MNAVRQQLHYIPAPRKIKALGARRPHARLRAFLLLALFGVPLLGACAGSPRLEAVPAQAASEGALSVDGVRLTLFPDAWSAYPSDLSRTFTPLGVLIENGRQDEVQVRYEDFVCVDDGTRQYRAVPPGEVARAISGGLLPATPALGLSPVLVAGPWRPYWPHPWRPYYGLYGPWWSDPYYSYPSAWPRSAAQDVLTLGVREGRLLPGASVQGFLFFQQATARGSFLTVSWSPHLADGTPLAPVSMRFRIVR